MFSCNSKTNSEEKVSVDSTIELGEIDSTLLKKGVLQKLDYAIINLRYSDLYIQTLSKQSNLYDEVFLNDIKNVHEYESSKAKALNLGVYGADLNYIIHYNQIPLSFKYLLCTKQLADNLGVSMAFDKKAVDKFNSNIDQKDTLVNIVNSAYDVIKKYLRNGNQFQGASLVMIGSWIENMYITLAKVEKCTNPQDKMAILSSLVKQKVYLKNLISLLADLNDQNEDYLLSLRDSLKEIDFVFDRFSDCPKKNELANLRAKIAIVRASIVATQ